ncbi:MAG: 3-deoxy-D-manno-octulosonic acid kinase [Xanthomonadales bacterium]|nr:3-deoxy-D-manno-octulosonic acid kinase [Gammaproteobacteria bacterium]MBT8053622.1 3-deoxy-D-manno-octulosonic acid kinase [Gammaproteobacteria bacterium]NNK51010.1 3-deoxy-D-manno-octulosonic acid kinase [Xanthomonadales bacterium]
MKTRTHKIDAALIVYDADYIPHPGMHLFDPEYWAEQSALEGEATGRGRALFLDAGFAPAVLRQYLRGGWASRVSRNRYVFAGFERSRPVMEYKMLEQLFSAGLPVPAPLAALCQQDGRLYSGWLMTHRIVHSLPLADVIGGRRDTESLWEEMGACIRRFHDYGVVHADLNARNLLVGEDGTVHLIDFDRARIRKGDTRAFGSNLKRLRRSLEKVWPKAFREQFQPSWSRLLDGYARYSAIK